MSSLGFDAVETGLAPGARALGPWLSLFSGPQNVRSRAVMERIGLAHDPDGDFDHPRVHAGTHPRLVRHVLYRLDRATWESRQVAAAR